MYELSFSIDLGIETSRGSIHVGLLALFAAALPSALSTTVMSSTTVLRPVTVPVTNVFIGALLQGGDLGLVF